MKRTFLLFVLMVISIPSFGDPEESLTLNQIKSLPSDKQNEYPETVNQQKQILASKEVEINGKKVLIDLVFSPQNLTNTPEMRLVAHDDEKEYILWWVDTGDLSSYESTFEIGNRKDIAALGFNFGAGSFLLFEINLKVELQKAKIASSRIASSGWFDNSSGGNDLRQQIIWSRLPDMSKDVRWASNIKLHEEGEQWIISFDVKNAVQSLTRYYYEYPVGGTGLTFLKKERLSQEGEDNQTYVGKLWVALGVVCLFIAVRIFFVFRKRAKQKLAT